jgi:hypothetical protein
VDNSSINLTQDINISRAYFGTQYDVSPALRALFARLAERKSNIAKK